MRKVSPPAAARWVVVLAVLLGLLSPAAAGAASPPLLNWGALVPGFTPGLDTSSSNVCSNGSHRCVESVIRQMNRDLEKMARRCDHDAIFQLGYTRTTEAYYESSQVDGFYDDVAWLHHYDAVFASYYLQPQKDWERGRTDLVAPAWHVAFGAADDQAVDATGNFLLGMNAHINRDLPFVLADIGLTDADGNSRKPDHEAVNGFLNQVGDDMVPEMVARFDPTFDTNSDDDVLVGFTVQQVIQEWRERAWHNASLMAYADPVVASLVAQGIEQGSAMLAQQVREAYAYDDDADRQARNDWCAAYGRDYDGFDGTYLDDGEDDPIGGIGALAGDLLAVPDMQGISNLPRPAASLAELARLGVHVDVSLTTGVTITLR